MTEIEKIAVATRRHTHSALTMDEHRDLVREVVARATGGVGAEPVAWVVTAADKVDYIFGEKDKAAQHGIPRPLYASPTSIRQGAKT